MTKLPKLLVPCLILIMFVFFCLIFRTCNQSKLFEFLTSLIRMPPPETIQNLLQRNYTVIYYEDKEWHRINPAVMSNGFF